MPTVTHPTPRGNQIAIIGAPVTPIAVIACAGSGKTLTATHRLIKISRSLGHERTRVALLSFSNVAVETFLQTYRQITGSSTLARNVEITTLDSFLTTNILRAHAHRTMRFDGVPFLVTGQEQFISSFTVPTPTHPTPLTSVHCEKAPTAWNFFYQPRGEKIPLDRGRVLQVVRRLGVAGGYTHNLGRFWAYETLANQPSVLRSLALRYKHILIDEAQDLGTAHQALLQLLVTQGVQISLIGDPNQAIYEFTGATGDFLRDYAASHGATPFQLTENYRSLLPILNVANRISARDDSTMREATTAPHGAFFTSYRPNTERDLVNSFIEAIAEAGLRLENSAVLCRANALCKRIKGETDPPGQGIVSIFADAAIRRDTLRDYSGAFCLVVAGISKLLNNPPSDFIARVTSAESIAPYRKAKQLLWSFASRTANGLPSIERLGSTQWHPELTAALRLVLRQLETECGFATAENLGRKLANREMPAGPLAVANPREGSRIRIDTVHQAKGESLDAVLYIATREHAEALANGVGTELGRIGYVALTRARNLFWLAVPQGGLARISPQLQAAGLNQL